MNENFSFTSTSNKILKEYFYLYLIIFILFLSYNIFRIAINPNFELNYTIFIVLGLNLLWSLFTNMKVRELTFNQNDQKIIVKQKAFWGKEKSYFVNYADLNYELESNNNFWSKINGRKEITFLKNKMELFKINKSAGFSENEILNIEKNLREIKNACS